MFRRRQARIVIVQRSGETMDRGFLAGPAGERSSAAKRPVVARSHHRRTNMMSSGPGSGK